MSRTWASALGSHHILVSSSFQVWGKGHSLQSCPQRAASYMFSRPFRPWLAHPITSALSRLIRFNETKMNATLSLTPSSSEPRSSPALFHRLEEASQGTTYTFWVLVTDRPLEEAQETGLTTAEATRRSGCYYQWETPKDLPGSIKRSCFCFHWVPSSRKASPVPLSSTQSQG